MKKFLKKAEIKLENGGYLVDKDSNPVSNVNFVHLQKRAEYICTFAQLAKGRDFVGKKAATLDDLRNDVLSALADKSVKYVDTPTQVKQDITEKLKKEALSFMQFQQDSTTAQKVNQFLQEFNTLKEFEEFGLFFEEDIVKLNKIYTMDEIVSAVKEVIDLLK